MASTCMGLTHLMVAAPHQDKMADGGMGEEQLLSVKCEVTTAMESDHTQSNHAHYLERGLG